MTQTYRDFIHTHRCPVCHDTAVQGPIHRRCPECRPLAIVAELQMHASLSKANGQHVAASMFTRAARLIRELANA